MSAGSTAAHGPAGDGYKERLKRLAQGALDPLVRFLASLGLTPDHLTWTGLVLSVIAGVAFYDGQSRIAAIVLIVGGLCDILDGQLARAGNRVSKFGAFLDSTLDRLGESFVLLGLAGFYASNLLGLYSKSLAVVGLVARGELEGPLALPVLQHQLINPRAWVFLTVVSVLALIGSFMVSYTRARAEGLGLECKVGWFERPERIILLIIAGLIQWFWVMSVTLFLLAVFSFLTTYQRMAHVWRLTRGAGSDS